MSILVCCISAVVLIFYTFFAPIYFNLYFQFVKCFFAKEIQNASALELNMHRVSCTLFIFWLQAIFAMYRIQSPELEFLSKNLGPIECVRFYNLLRRQTPWIIENKIHHQPQQVLFKSDCKNLLKTWLASPRKKMNKVHKNVELTLRQIGRTDLAHWLAYNVIHQRQLVSKADKGYQQEVRRNVAVRYKGEDPAAKLTSDETIVKSGFHQTVLQKVVVTLIVISSMMTICLCCYKFLYGRMRGGHFTNFRYKYLEPRRFDDRVKNELDEESWLQQGCRQSARGSDFCCSTSAKESWWNSVDCLKYKPISAIEYCKSIFKGHANYSRGKRSCQLKLLITRLQKTCPTQRKIIHLNRKERNLLKSLTDAEKHQFPATNSDLKFLLSSDREKRKLLAREGRREFLIELRKRLEKRGPGSNRHITLNETERNFIRKLSSSERLLLPIMDKDLELLVSNPLEKRQVMLKQMACIFSGKGEEDRKYLELENNEKKFLKEIDDKEKKKLGITDSEFRFLVASRSQRNVMQQRLGSCERDQRIKVIRRKLGEVNYDVSCLQLSKLEHSSFLSLNFYELAHLGLTEEHVKFYAASDCERKVIWPSPSQHRNLRLNTLQTKLSKLPWKDCSTRLTSSEHTLLASLTPREQDKLHISDSEKNFMLSTDSEKELIQRQRNIERLETKIRDFNTVTMTESERRLILSLSPSEMQMLNMDETNKSSLLRRKSHNAIDREIWMKIESIKSRVYREGLSNVRLTNSERGLIESLNNLEVDSCNLTPSELSFLLQKKSSKRMDHRESNYAHETGIQCTGSLSSKDMQMNTSPHICHRQTENAPNSHIHSHSTVHFAHDDNHSNFPEFRHKVQFRDPEPYSGGVDQCDGDGRTAFPGESTDDSELSETYDELGMLFSQQMKQQSRPCQRKYCLLGRHLKRGSQHDERQCQVRHYCCRGYPSDQRPSCSSGNVCKDTYDEFQLMHARPHEKKELNSSMFERRKQFLDQPCQKCSPRHNCVLIR